MKVTAVLTLALAGALFTATSSRADLFDKTGQAGMTFLKIGTSARAAGMGDAYTALSTGAVSAFYNPAGLGFTEGYVDATVGQVNWVADIKIMSASVAIPVRLPGTGPIAAVALSYVATDYGTVWGTVINTNAGVPSKWSEIGKIEPTETVLGLTVARRFTDKFSLGGTVKYMNQTLPWYNSDMNDDGKADDDLGLTPAPEALDAAVKSFVFDAGTMYRTGFGSSVVSMSLRNFSKSQRYEIDEVRTPLTFNIGMSMDAFDLAPALQEGGHHLVVAADGIHPPDHPEKLSFGGEYSFADFAFLRAGYNFNTDAKKFSLGVGLKGSIRGIGASVDYAYTDMGASLGSVNYFSLSFSAK